MGEKITVEQAASILGYHPKHVYRLLKQGRIPYELWKDVYMLDADEIAALKAKQDEHGRIRWPKSG